MKNKKGFTLVELLAVIVILALIMSIAVISIGGVLNSTRQNTFKETAVSIINGVRQQLIVNNQLDAGDYIFNKSLLDKGADQSPLGGTLTIPSSLSTASGGNCAGGTMVGDNVCKLTSTDTTCSAGVSASFVRVSVDANKVYTYRICLAAGDDQKYINLGTESALLNSSDTTMIMPS